MHSRCLRRLCLLAIATLLLACTRHPKNDEEIQKDIQTKAAAEPTMKNSQITVEVKDGKVTLKGTVTTQEARTMLEALTKEEPRALAWKTRPQLRRKYLRHPPPRQTQVRRARYWRRSVQRRHLRLPSTQAGDHSCRNCSDRTPRSGVGF